MRLLAMPSENLKNIHLLIAQNNDIATISYC